MRHRQKVGPWGPDQVWARRHAGGATAAGRGVGLAIVLGSGSSNPDAWVFELIAIERFS